MRPVVLALTWDPTISAGNVLSAVMILGGLLIGYVSLRERLITMEVKLQPVWDEYNERRKEIRRAEDRE